MFSNNLDYCIYSPLFVPFIASIFNYDAHFALFDKNDYNKFICLLGCQTFKCWGLP